MNLLAAFLLGLAGSLHCVLMCGPLVLAINAARRSNTAHSVAYHGGRLLTYCSLGAISGLLGAGLVFAGFQRWLSIAAGVLILLAALTAFHERWTGFAGKMVFAAKSKFGRLLQNRAVGATALLGGLNGLLPCGMVYIACAAAAAAGTITGGIATMLAFGLGTAPMMLSIGFAGRLFRWNNPLLLRKVTMASTVVVGLLLIARGLALGIPYLSPNISNGHVSTCCQLKGGSMFPDQPATPH